MSSMKHRTNWLIYAKLNRIQLLVISRAPLRLLRFTMFASRRRVYLTLISEK